jgi:hypothetical protein
MVVDDALDQDLDLPAALLATEESCPDHARIVEYQQIAGGEQFRQVADAVVAQRRTGEVQQPARRTFGGRVLGDQFDRVVRNRNRRGSAWHDWSGKVGVAMAGGEKMSSPLVARRGIGDNRRLFQLASRRHREPEPRWRNR